ncbi:hypothetical protein H8959_001538 [Pygathrix nigripes]
MTAASTCWTGTYGKEVLYGEGGKDPDSSEWRQRERFPLLKPAVISQLEGGGELGGPSPLAAGTGLWGLRTGKEVDIQTDNDLTKEMYEGKENVTFELQRDFSQETDFSEASLLEKPQEVYSTGNIKKEKSNTIDGTGCERAGPQSEVVKLNFIPGRVRRQLGEKCAENVHYILLKAT